MTATGVDANQQRGPMSHEPNVRPTLATAPPDSIITSSPRALPVDRATAAVRRVMDALMRTDHASAELDRVAAELDAVADHLDEHAGTIEQRLIEMWRGDGITRHDPVTGMENPIAPPLTLTGRADGSVDGVVILGLPYQGPPGYVHGGVAAQLLDHTFGVANGWAGSSGATAQLNVRYHRPTPLFVPLTVSARTESVSGSKINTAGDIRTADGTVCVSAEGLFIARMLPRPR